MGREAIHDDHIPFLAGQIKRFLPVIVPIYHGFLGRDVRDVTLWKQPGRARKLPIS